MEKNTMEKNYTRAFEVIKKSKKKNYDKLMIQAGRDGWKEGNPYIIWFKFAPVKVDKNGNVVTTKIKNIITKKEEDVPRFDYDKIKNKKINLEKMIEILKLIEFMDENEIKENKDITIFWTKGVLNVIASPYWLFVKYVDSSTKQEVWSFLNESERMILKIMLKKLIEKEIDRRFLTNLD